MYQIVKAEKLADKIFLMEIEAPRVARACQPGQFLIVKMDEVGERIPLTICDYNRERGTVTIVFQTVGASTEKMSWLREGDFFHPIPGVLNQYLKSGADSRSGFLILSDIRLGNDNLPGNNLQSSGCITKT